MIQPLQKRPKLLKINLGLLSLQLLKQQDHFIRHRVQGSCFGQVRMQEPDEGLWPFMVCLELSRGCMHADLVQFLVAVIVLL